MFINFSDLITYINIIWPIEKTCVGTKEFKITLKYLIILHCIHIIIEMNKEKKMYYNIMTHFVLLYYQMIRKLQNNDCKISFFNKFSGKYII